MQHPKSQGDEDGEGESRAGDGAAGSHLTS